MRSATYPTTNMARKKTGACVECGERHSNHKWIEGAPEPELDERCFNCYGIIEAMKAFSAVVGTNPLIGKPRKLIIEKYRIEKIKAK